MEKQTNSTKSEDSKTVVVKRWYWYLGLIIVLLHLGILQAFFMGGLALLAGNPKLALVELISVPLELWDRLIFTIPIIIHDPIVGMSLFIGNITIPGIGIWLMCRKPKKEEGK